MNAMTDVSLSSSASAFECGLTLEAVRALAPAVFAEGAHQRLSSKYTFVPSEKILTGLMSAGFIPVEARQTHARKASPMHARHIVRLRRRFETVQLRDSVPEVVFLNSHDGSSGYQVRLGLMRVVCLNGLIVSRGAFPSFCVSHRGNVVDQVVEGALMLGEDFGKLAAEVERMERRRMGADEQLRFAERALVLKYPDAAESGMAASQVLTIRRPEDTGDDLYTILNRTQENLLRGGLTRRPGASGRLSRTRRVTSIRKDIALNSQLWDLAREVLAA